MTGLETVIDHTESPVTAEYDVKLSVIGVLCMIPEGCDDVSNWRVVNGEQQGTKHTTLRHSV